MTETIVWRRPRRRRWLRSILSPLYRSTMLLCALTLACALIPCLSVSAAMRMPRIGDGLITDGDGIIRESVTENAQDGLLPDVSEGLSEFTEDMAEGSTTAGETDGKPSPESTAIGTKPSLPEITTESVIMPAAAGGLWVVVLILILLSFAVVTLVILWGKRR